MATGVGEASAILAVAQLGIKLSHTLISYVGEVKDAQNRIRRIGSEIATTSQTLSQIGDLVKTNGRTKYLNQEGIRSAERCSMECSVIIECVRSELEKTGWQADSSANASFLTTLYWPFVRGRLELPRTELQRIKADLTLLLTSAWVLRAPTSAEKERLMQDIPKLEKKRARLAQVSELVKDQVGWEDDDTEMFERYIKFQEERFQEEEQRRLKEQAALLQAEEEERKRLEDEHRRKVEQNAVDGYKRRQEELQTRTAENKKVFRDELKGLNLGDREINIVHESSRLNFSPAENAPTFPTIQPSTAIQKSPATDVASLTPTIHELQASSRASKSRSRLKLPWRRPKGHSTQNPLDKSMEWAQMKTPVPKDHKPLAVETWLVNMNSFEKMQTSSSFDWSHAAAQRTRKVADAWNSVAKLKPVWSSVIFQFLKDRNRDEDSSWNLLDLQILQKWSRARLLGQQVDPLLVQLVICKPCIDGERFRSSDRGTRLEPLLDRSLEKASSEGQLTVPSNKTELSSLIRTLETKKAKLADDDHERVREIQHLIEMLEKHLRMEETLARTQDDKIIDTSPKAYSQKRDAFSASRPRPRSPPFPAPPRPSPVKAPPIYQERITHHQNIDHGVAPIPRASVRYTDRSRERGDPIPPSQEYEDYVFEPSGIKNYTSKRREHSRSPVVVEKPSLWPKPAEEQIIIRRNERSHSPERDDQTRLQTIQSWDDWMIERSRSRERENGNVETIKSEGDVMIRGNNRSPTWEGDFEHRRSRDGNWIRERRAVRDSDRESEMRFVIQERENYDSENIARSPKGILSRHSRQSRSEDPRSSEKAVALRTKRSFTRERPRSLKRPEDRLILRGRDRTLPGLLRRQPSVYDYEHPITDTIDRSQALVRRSSGNPNPYEHPPSNAKAHHEDEYNGPNMLLPRPPEAGRNTTKVGFSGPNLAILPPSSIAPKMRNDPWKSLLHQLYSRALDPQNLESDDDMSETEVAKSYLRKYTNFRDAPSPKAAAPANRSGVSAPHHAPLTTRRGTGIKKLNTAPVSGLRHEALGLSSLSPSGQEIPVPDAQLSDNHTQQEPKARKRKDATAVRGTDLPEKRLEQSSAAQPGSGYISGEGEGFPLGNIVENPVTSGAPEEKSVTYMDDSSQVNPNSPQLHDEIIESVFPLRASELNGQHNHEGYVDSGSMSSEDEGSDDVVTGREEMQASEEDFAVNGISRKTTVEDFD